jgi:CelD/BcsL family acetyltransferase involved in cellulose biosynthesis
LSRFDPGSPLRSVDSSDQPSPPFASELELSWSSVDELRSEWAPLAELTGNIFATWDWIAAWLEHLGPRRELRIAACRRPDGSLAAIVALYLDRRGPLRVLRFIGSGPSDALGPICDPAAAGLSGQALSQALRAAGTGWDVLLAERLPGDIQWERALGARLLLREDFPVLRFRGRTWEEVLAERSSNFREQVRRRERRLFREHDVRYRLVTDPERLDADLDTLIQLHRARWGNARSGAFEGHRERFHRAFARSALRQGWLRLWMLEVDGSAVASWYGFRYGNSESYYQAGRDPAWERQSVGFVLLIHTIREAAQDGLGEYRFLRGGEAYKGRFAEEDPGVQTFASARGARGRTALAATTAALALPAPLRSRFVAFAR